MKHTSHIVDVFSSTPFGGIGAIRGAQYGVGMYRYDVTDQLCVVEFRY
jgi:hypothetical protein